MFMKAVVMAGGEGRRLRPLTANIPKPMVRLCGRPILEYVFRLLERAGVDEAWVTLGYKPTAVTNYFRGGAYGSLKLNFITEQEPLGTAGGVKNAVYPIDEDFIVISGDALCDFDLAAAAAYHREKDAAITVLTRRVSDPREYGLADVAADGTVRGFLEKPGWQEAFTDLANTGIYVVSGPVLAEFPDGFCDFAKDIFPKLVRDGRLAAMRCEGYWRDVGDVGSYLAAQHDILAGKVKCEQIGTPFGGSVFAGEKPDGNYVIEAPCYIGRGVSIGDGAIVGAFTVAEDKSVIGARARTGGCVLCSGATLGENSLSRGCVVCSDGAIGRGATAAAGSVVGPRSLLGEDAVLGEGVVLGELEVVPDETIVTESPADSESERPQLGEDGITGRLGVSITPEFCLRLGRLLAQAFEGRPICLADDGMNISYLHRQTLGCGILAAGGQVCDMGVMFPGQLQYAVSGSGSPAGVLVSGYGQGLRFVFDGGAPRRFFKQLESLLSHSPDPPCAEVIRLTEVMSGVSALWENRLLAAAGSGKINFSGSFSCRSAAVAETAARLFMTLGGRSDKSVVFTFPPDGSSVSMSRGGSQCVSGEQFVGVCALLDFSRGLDVVVTQDAPRLLEKLAATKGGRVWRRPAGGELSVWAADGVSTLIYALAGAGSQENLDALLRQLPPVGTYNRRVQLDSTSAAVLGELLEKVGGRRMEQGVALPSDEGWVSLRPGADGRSLRVSAEAVSAETAAELCDGFERWLDSRK